MSADSNDLSANVQRVHESKLSAQPLGNALLGTCSESTDVLLSRIIRHHMASANPAITRRGFNSSVASHVVMVPKRRDNPQLFGGKEVGDKQTSWTVWRGIYLERMRHRFLPAVGNV